MRKIRYSLGVALLALSLSSGTFAGEMQGPGYTEPPPPPPPERSSVEGDGNSPTEANQDAQTLQDILTEMLLRALLGIF